MTGRISGVGATVGAGMGMSVGGTVVAVGEQDDFVAASLHRYLIERFTVMDCRRRGPGDEIDPVIVLPSPYANGSVVADLGNDESAVLRPAVPSVRVLIVHN